MNHPDRLTSYRDVAFAWVICFSIATVWESAFRVLTDHQSWDQTQVLHFTGGNLAFAVVCSLLFAFPHRLLLMIGDRFPSRRSLVQKLLWPETGVAAATLLAMVVWVVRYRFRLEIVPAPVDSVLLILPLVLIYFVCMVSARRLHRHILPRFRFPVLIYMSILAIVLPIVALIFTQWFRNHERPVAGSQRNQIDRVVLISVDTLRRDFVSAYDAKYVRTPVIDQIANEGALFLNALSPMPETGPSHISMVTGLSPLDHGVMKNGFVIPKNIETLAMVLRKAGFRTAGFVSGYPLQVFNSHLDRGFQKYDDHFSWIDHVDGAYCGRFFGAKRFVGRYFSRSSRSTTDSVLNWLNASSSSPCFLFVHYYDPHRPYGGELRARSDETYLSKEDLPRQRKLYGLEVENVDAQIGRIVSLLKQKGIYNRTLLIFTADHGESLGEHQDYYSHMGLHEPVIRVPLIIRCPGQIQTGQIITQQVVITNIFRTVLKALKLESTQASNSLDLIALANGRTDQHNPVIVCSKFHLRNVKYSVRTPEWKLIRTDGLERTYELYYLRSDPSELINLYTEKKAIAQSLESILSGQPGLRKLKRIRGLSDEQIENLKSLGYIQ